MQRQTIITADGSHSISVPSMEVTYHSKHGAIQESMHVFIHAGLHFFLEQSPTNTVRILEMGFGTGLNALLTLIESERKEMHIEYETLEAFPLDQQMTDELNYSSILEREDLSEAFKQLHDGNWSRAIDINPHFNFQKHQTTLQDFSTDNTFDIVFYDAFAPGAQPELWTAAIFKKLFGMMNDKGILVTYCSKGDVRRAMIEAGFTVKKIPGPKGKREMLQAKKVI